MVINTRDPRMHGNGNKMIVCPEIEENKIFIDVNKPINDVKPPKYPYDIFDAASKGLLFKSLKKHNEDENAHSKLFSDITNKINSVSSESDKNVETINSNIDKLDTKLEEKAVTIEKTIETVKESIPSIVINFISDND